MTTKLLNDVFSSFAEAIGAFQSITGKFDIHYGELIKSFCAANSTPMTTIASTQFLKVNEYFESTLWLKSFIDRHGFRHIGIGNYIWCDSYNRPLAFISLNIDSRENFKFEAFGAERIIIGLIDEIKANTKAMDEERDLPTYIEMTEIDEDGDVSLEQRTLYSDRVCRQEYYPYLEGGVESLLAEFLQSDETVLILMGPPGTGKSSAIFSSAEVFNLELIYANSVMVTQHPKFVSELFKLSDARMAEASKDLRINRSSLFTDRSLLSDVNPRANYQSVDKDTVDSSINASVTSHRQTGGLFNYYSESSFSPSMASLAGSGKRIPLAVVEDADLLLRPRSAGNAYMQQLLNETDGANSNELRKVVFTTNQASLDDIDPALYRDGRCFGVIDFRNLTPEEAVIARKVAGRPDFEKVPTTSVPLATALKKPRKRLYLNKTKSGVGYVTH